MNDFFIEKIEIKENRHIQRLDIPLSKVKRKHLIFTGKNGSGKTTTLQEINTLLNKLIGNGFANIKNLKNSITSYEKTIVHHNQQIEKYNKQIEVLNKQKALLPVDDLNRQKITQIDNNIKSYSTNILNSKNEIKQLEGHSIGFKKQIEDFSKVNLIFSNQNEIYESIVNRQFILAFFEAKRENTPTVSTAIQNINLNTNNTTDTKQLHKKFIEYMVKKRVDMLNDKFDGDGKKAIKIEEWFNNFENTLKLLFNETSLILKYYSEELNFKIEYQGKSFGLNELSDGYSSLLAILTELILRMEAHGVKAYDMQGIVLIDEIETHLHVDLQKKILPFLVNFFPNIQFIITTHSPFVLSSLSNTVICDLEKNFITEDLTGYSYESLVDSYFDTDKYSQEVKDKLKRFEELTIKDNDKQLVDKQLVDKELREYLKLEIFFDTLPKYQNEEIGFHFNRIQQLKLGN